MTFVDQQAYVTLKARWKKRRSKGMGGGGGRRAFAGFYRWS